MEGKQPVRLLAVTWNLHGKAPSGLDLGALLPRSRYHLYAVGTEECERSIEKSVVFTKKKRWEAALVAALGPDYVMLRAHTLQAIHLIVFCHAGVLPLVSAVGSSCVATGIADTMGNKGGIGIGFRLGRTSVLVVNCHLAAGEDKVADAGGGGKTGKKKKKGGDGGRTKCDERNAHADKIDRGLRRMCVHCTQP